MHALRRRAWWALVFLTVLLTLFGIGDVIIGPAFDPGIALGLTGLMHAELQAESAAGYLLLDFYTRAGGANLAVMGLALTVIVLVPYRAGRTWAWWTLWLIPAWTAAVFALNAAFGVAPGQAPPPPMLSGPILGAIAVAALLVDRPRSFRAEALQREPVTT
jgi:hypothetical protein